MSWLVIAAIGLITFSLRASFVLAFPGGADPRIERALRYVPVAVLPALAASAVIGNGSSLDYRVAAAALAALVAWRTKSVAATMASGMAVLWLLSAWG